MFLRCPRHVRAMGYLDEIVAIGTRFRSVHDDWQIRCETPPGAQAEQCALFQSVVAEDRANVGITVLVLKTADQKARPTVTSSP